MKPQMKKEAAVFTAVPSVRIINFDGTPDAARDFASFGKVTQWADYPDRYQLAIDARFDFYEVLRYIEDYG